MARFQIRGLIVAPRLPQSRFSMFDCLIERTPGPESSADVRRPPLAFTPAPPVPGIDFGHVEILPPHVKVEARHSITTVVEAELDRDAIQMALERFGRCLSAIIFASDPTAQGMVLATHSAEVPTGAAAGTPLQSVEVGTSINFMPVLVAPLDPRTEQNIRALEQLCHRDEASSSLLGLWNHAEQANLLAFSNRDNQEVLIRYALVLEKVGRAMAPELRQDTPEAIVSIARKLQEEIRPLLAGAPTDSSAAALAESIERGRREIQRLRIETIGQQIQSAGDRLTMDQRARTGAKDAWKDRNKLAGHPSEGQVQAQHLTNARSAAGSYLQAYLSWRFEHTGS